MSTCLHCKYYRPMFGPDTKQMNAGHCYYNPPVILAMPVPVPVNPVQHTIRAAQAGRRGEAPPPEMEYSVQPVALRANVRETDFCHWFAIDHSGGVDARMAAVNDPARAKPEVTMTRHISET